MPPESSTSSLSPRIEGARGLRIDGKRRVNMVNLDAIFGDEEVSSKLWDLVGPDRMRARGLDAEGLKEYYRQGNLLKARVLAEHVGNVVVFFASNQTPTTGATFPVDGGIPADLPRRIHPIGHFPRIYFFTCSPASM